MKMMPSINEVGREALIVLGGAILAALVMGHVPALREWVKAQWADTPH